MNYIIMLSMAALFVLSGCKTTPPAEPLPTPSLEKTIMYEIYVRNFSPEGTFKGIVPKLDSLKAMGVNTVWLMPIHPVGKYRRKGTFGSPYSIQDYYKVNPEFGTEQDFKNLVEACHARGMYLIIDLVINHTAWDHSWIKEHPEWYTRDAGDTISPPVPDWSDVADLNFDEPALQDELIRMMKYWIEEYNIDGYRCDVAMMVPNSFWRRSITEIRKLKPLIMLAEASGKEFHEAGFDFTYGWELYKTLKDVCKSDSSAVLFSKTAIEEGAKAVNNGRILRFVTNHDETSWDDVPLNLFGGVEGSLTAFTACCLLPSVPLLYNGQEVAHPTKMNLFEHSPIDWTANRSVTAEYSKILGLLRNHAVLQDTVLRFWLSDHLDAVGYSRGQGGDAVHVLVNFRNRPVEIDLPADFSTSKWKLLLGTTPSASADPADAPTRVTLPPHARCVFQTGS
jgi:glycosidase